MINLTQEMSEKILLGLKGDEESKQQSIDFLEKGLESHLRKKKIWELSFKWVENFIRERWWNHERFAHMKKSLIEHGTEDEGIKHQVYNMMEGIYGYLDWQGEVVWSRFAHRDPPFPMEESDLPEFLGYINQGLKNVL